MTDDINIPSDDEFHASSSEDEEEEPAMFELLDSSTYRFPKDIMIFEDDISDTSEERRKIQFKIERCSDQLLAFASFGTTRLCCIVSNPVNEADVEDFEAGLSVTVSGAPYISEINLRELIEYIIPSNRLQRTFIQIRFIVYSDRGGILPVALMSAQFALTASAIDVKGVVCAASVLITPDGKLIANASKTLEEKARSHEPGYGYITALKIMEDGHIRWYEMEGIPKRSYLAAAFKKAADSAASQYPQMAKMIKQLTDRGPNFEGVLG